MRAFRLEWRSLKSAARGKEKKKKAKAVIITQTGGDSTAPISGSGGGLHKKGSGVPSSFAAKRGFWGGIVDPSGKR